MSFKIYSIESRKGGVGKTTIALNLAKVLLEEGPVLLLDCDITGTSLSEPTSNSLQWARSCNVVKGEDGTNFNLLSYFVGKFTNGVVDIDKFVNKVILDRDKINVIGSDIYNDDYTTVVDPRLLMDELHSYWLKELIEQIVCSFEKSFSEEIVHVIIDNSPGYVGLCQTLHNYMYRLGPEKAKFILVSSVDAQDLQACLSASNEIYQSIENRIRIARYYESLNDKGPIDSNIEELMDKDGSLRRFFFKLSDEENLVSNYQVNNVDVRHYLRIVLNKLPKKMSDGSIQVDYQKLIQDKQKEELFSKVASVNEEGLPQSVVFYDEKTSYQYFQKYIVYHNKAKEGDESYWKGRFKSLHQQNKDTILNDDRLKTSATLNTLYENLVKSLIDKNYIYMASSMDENWAPKHAMNTMRDLVSSWSEKLSRIPSNFYVGDSISQLHLWNENILMEMRDSGSAGNFLVDVKALISYVESLANLGRSDQSPKLFLLLSVLLHAVFQKYQYLKAPYVDMRSFLVEQLSNSIREDDWRKYVERSEIVYNRRIWVKSTMCPMFAKEFNDFYVSCCNTLLRLIDVNNDFDALLTTIQLYVPGEPSSEAELSNEMKDYLTDVICLKKSLFNDSQALNIKNYSKQMEKIQNMLKEQVLSNWL